MEAYLVVLALLVLCALSTAVNDLAGRFFGPGGRDRTRTVQDLVDVTPEATEARLVRRRLAGGMTAGDYRRAMAELAAADAERNPVVVPPKGRGHPDSAGWVT
jgi:hypothetical protein